jgi:hypothetical protein
LQGIIKYGENKIKEYKSKENIKWVNAVKNDQALFKDLEEWKDIYEPRKVQIVQPKKPKN